MDLDTYRDWALAEVDWFHKRLIREGPEALQASCEKLGEGAVREVLRARKTEIRDYLQTPKNRRDAILRSVPDEGERHAFLIAAAYTARCAAAWLDMAASRGVSADYRPSRSFLAVQAADAAMELAANFPSLWPFEDLRDPFGS